MLLIYIYIYIYQVPEKCPSFPLYMLYLYAISNLFYINHQNIICACLCYIYMLYVCNIHQAPESQLSLPLYMSYLCVCLCNIYVYVYQAPANYISPPLYYIYALYAYAIFISCLHIYIYISSIRKLSQFAFMLYRQVGIDRVVDSERLGTVVVSALVQKLQEVRVRSLLQTQYFSFSSPLRHSFI